MIDIKRIRENPEAIIASINSRQSKDYTEEVKAVLKVDEERREVAGKRDGLKGYSSAYERGQKGRSRKIEGRT